jgi:hypothetical protein
MDHQNEHKMDYKPDDISIDADDVKWVDSIGDFSASFTGAKL